MIKNEQFWAYWRAGEFDEALNCQLSNEPKRRGAGLFKRSQTTVITAISAGEFLYDYLMIDPTVVDGLDFARADDLSNLFQLSRFAETIDTESLTGDMAQLQGYVAEQMIAQELAAAGHDVQFPNASNQAGWDLLVDGQHFQVKCAASKQVVEAHFEKYPETPVIVNAELAPLYAGNPMVLSTSVSREQVLADTKKTLDHAADIMDFELPWITFGVSAFTNVHRIRKDGILLSTAARNVAADTASRSAMAAAGQTVLGAIGTVLMPGAGSIVFPVVGAFIGLSQGGKLSNVVKRQFAKKEEAALCKALNDLIDQMLHVLMLKQDVKVKKWQQLQENLPMRVGEAFSKKHKERLQLLENVCNELQSIRRSVEEEPVKAFERILNVLGKAGIHVYTLRRELAQVELALLAYGRKI